MLSLEFAGGIDQHAFDGRTVVGFPLIRFALRKIALGEKLVECGDGLGLVERGCALGEIDFRRFAHRSVDESDARGTRRGGNSLVRSGYVADFYAEKYVAAVIGPMQSAFDCLVVCERARRRDS